MGSCCPSLVSFYILVVCALFNTTKFTHLNTLPRKFYHDANDRVEEEIIWAYDEAGLDIPNAVPICTLANPRG